MNSSNERKARLRVLRSLLLVCWVAFLSQGVLPAETGHFLSLDQILTRWRSLQLSETQSAAEQGDLTAQHYLGYYHAEGLGGVTNEAEGLRWYLMAAEKGFPNSQNDVGVLYLKGKGVKMDYRLAAEWMEKAAQQGFPPALRNLGSLMRQDKYPRRLATKLREMHEKAAATGDPEAQIQLGHFLFRPSGGGAIETQDAIYWYKKALAQGRHDACYHIGEALILTNDPRQKETAALWYQRGADLGDESCQAAIGWISFTGQGVKQDAEKGLKIAREFAEKGHVGMMYTLGRYYADEKLPVPSPIPKDMPKAMMWYRKAAEAGQTAAMEMLGQHLLAERTPEGEKEGLQWLIKAEAAGVWSAKQRLADLSVARPGLVPDEWTRIEEVAQGGYADQMAVMAKRYREGKEVPRDNLQAACWTLKYNLKEYGEPWGEAAGVDGRGQLRPQATAMEREFGEVYIALVTALREEQPVFFKTTAQASEKAAGENSKQLVFAAVCYELAGKFGDPTAQNRAEALRSRLNRQDQAKVSYWLNWMASSTYWLKRQR